jgi:hypothetical protein
MKRIDIDQSATSYDRTDAGHGPLLCVEHCGVNEIVTGNLVGQLQVRTLCICICVCVCVWFFNVPFFSCGIYETIRMLFVSCIRQWKTAAP